MTTDVEATPIHSAGLAQPEVTALDLLRGVIYVGRTETESAVTIRVLHQGQEHLVEGRSLQSRGDLRAGSKVAVLRVHRELRMVVLP